jgi:uncharacterized membrane protein YqiK
VEARKTQGLAEAAAMESKAEAWRKYNEAAVLQLLAPLLPEIARAVAEPLSRIDRIRMINTGGGISSSSVPGGPDARTRAAPRSPLDQAPEGARGQAAVGAAASRRLASA